MFQLSKKHNKKTKKNKESESEVVFSFPKDETSKNFEKKKMENLEQPTKSLPFNSKGGGSV